MIFLLLAGLGIFVLSKSRGTATAQAPVSSTGSLTGTPLTNPGVISTRVHRNATGKSLSAALGNTQAPPSFYISGNPGTTGITLPPSSTINFYRPQHTSLRFVPSVSNPRGGSKSIPLAVGGTDNVTLNNPPKPFRGVTTSPNGKKKITYSPLINPAQSSRAIINPETPGAFWTKRRIGGKRAFGRTGA